MAQDVTNNKVIDFQTKRNENIEKKKRHFERVLFSEFLGAFAEIDDHGTKYPIQMLDISKTGLLIQVPYTKQAYAHFKALHVLGLRLYFTKDDFLPLSLSMKRLEEFIDERGEAYLRIGGEFDQSLPSFQAFKPFIEFIYKFAEYSCVDKGESKVYFL